MANVVENFIVGKLRKHLVINHCWLMEHLLSLNYSGQMTRDLPLT